jgi:PAS domain S-box-containing protein
MALLHIVHLEESESDAETVSAELKSGGIECHLIRVETESEFARAIEVGDVDIILADRHSPQCDGFRALAIAREKRPEVPFVFVTHRLDPEHAIATLSAGATDFVLKRHLSKLVPAVQRALRETGAQRDLQHVRQELLHHAELLDLASDAIIISDAAGLISYWNCGAERIYGWKREEAVGRNVHELLKTRSAKALGWLNATFRAKDHWQGELWQTRRDGVEIVVASSWTLADSTPNSPWLQINADVTDRVRAAEALRHSEERYRRFVDEDLTGNLIMKPDGSIITCNPEFVRTFGFDSIEEAQAANFMSLLHTKKEGAELLATLRRYKIADRLEIEMRQRGGAAVYVTGRFIGSFDDAGELTELKGYLFNDTKRKRLEQQLIQAQKMEGLGTLAGGIAHDFNNILSIILGYAGKLEELRTQPEQLSDAVNVIREAVERGASLVQQLLTSARQSEPHFVALDLNALVHELAKMLAATFPKTINFVLDLQPHLPMAKADRSQIHQVLLNLCANAREAMPNDGTITLETGVIASEQLREFFSGVTADRYAYIHVVDTGSGISKQVKPHIFEPFYTTKERGKGTGLGLSVVYGVMDNHRGFVQVDSEPGYGTTFSVYLPLESATEPASGNGERAPAGPDDLAQTVLLVEDEEMLRDLGVIRLEGDGYRVLAAKDGVEAVEMFAAHADEIGLVVCDLGLPRLGGREVFLKMKETKPNVRLIVASGYLEPNLRSEMLKAGVMDTIQKPYDFRELLEKIRSIIGQPQLS